MSHLRRIALELKRMARAARHGRLLSLLPMSPPPRTPAIDGVDFQCNVCGMHNRDVERALVSNREAHSCRYCLSSLRMRAVIHALSQELYGEPLLLPQFPRDKSLRGLGMSDWDGYALALAHKLNYTNTYYHTEPRLDITAPHERWLGQNRFLISCDVFEHIPIASLAEGFKNCRRLLRDDGVLLLTVPYQKSGSTVEHFPSLHDYRVVAEKGKRVLLNTTADGRHERFDDLIFHGGGGSTLEMRVFSEPDLLAALREAGFSSIRIYTDILPGNGILWPMDQAVPIAARA